MLFRVEGPVEKRVSLRQALGARRPSGPLALPYSARASASSVSTVNSARLAGFGYRLGLIQFPLVFRLRVRAQCCKTDQVEPEEDFGFYNDCCDDVKINQVPQREDISKLNSAASQDHRSTK